MPADAIEVPCIRMLNWDEYQHYSDRSPPWIKLHKKLLDNPDWATCSPGACKLLAECWLLASESEKGVITMTTAQIGWRLRRADSHEIAHLLQELESHHFIELCNHDASALIASGKHDDSTMLSVARSQETETERETEAEGEGELSSKSDSISDPAPLNRMHDLFIDHLGGDVPPYPKLTDTRKKKYRLLWTEHLASLAPGEWEFLWEALLRAITESDHHMSQRSWHMPESFLRNQERRDRWMLEARDLITGAPQLTAADRKLLKRRRALDAIDLNESTGGFE